MEQADRWAALYESAAERASQAESKIRRLEERIWQLEQEVLDWREIERRGQERTRTHTGDHGTARDRKD